MSNNITVLLFRLEGPLQSWGDKSKWGRRDTCDFPTKSGIVGLLSCAAGFERDNPAIYELSQQLDVSVRADSPGTIMTDFHTVNGVTLRAEDGKKKLKLKPWKEKDINDSLDDDDASTMLTYRQYLQDASFLVVIEGDIYVLKKCKAYLDNPVWAPCLGRISCVPGTPIIGEIINNYESIDELMQKYPTSRRFRNRTMMYETKSDNSKNGYLRNDEMTAYNRTFKQRFVSRHYVELEVD